MRVEVEREGCPLPEDHPGTVLNLRTTTSQKCAAVPRRARIEGSYSFVSLNSRLESNKEEKKPRD